MVCGRMIMRAKILHSSRPLEQPAGHGHLIPVETTPLDFHADGGWSPVRSEGDEVSSFSHRYPHHTGNTGFLVDTRRVDHGDAHGDREIAKLVEHANRRVVASADDRNHDEQVDVGIGAVVATCDGAEENDAAGSAPLDDPVGDLCGPLDKRSAVVENLAVDQFPFHWPIVADCPTSSNYPGRHSGR